MELRIHGYELTLRLADAEKIDIDQSADRREDAEHHSAVKRYRSRRPSFARRMSAANAAGKTDIARMAQTARATR